MGMRFRKSFGSGPFKVNLSKSGIGYSIGTKGFRHTKTANGRTRNTYSIPGTGISYVDEKSNKRKKVNNKKIENYDDNNLNQNNNFQEGKPKKKHKKLKIAFIVFCILGVLSACFGSPTPDEIILDENNITMDVTDSKDVLFTTDPTDAYIGDIKIKDTKNVTATIDDHTIKIRTLHKEGKYKLKIYTDDASATLYVTVVDKDKAAQEKKKIEEQKAQEEAQRQAELKAQEEARKAAEAQAAAEAEAQRQAAAQSSTSTQSERSSNYTEATSGEVYVPQSGSKYHSNPNCSNMKNPTAISLSEAQARGYQPCKKCYR